MKCESVLRMRGSTFRTAAVCRWHVNQQRKGDLVASFLWGLLICKVECEDLMVGISALKDAGAWYSALNVLVGLVEMEVALDLPLVNCVTLVGIGCRIAINNADKR